MNRRRKKKVFGSSDRPRLVVYRSLKSIYAQVVDDSNQKTMFGMSTLNKDIKSQIKKAKNKTEQSKIVGQSIAKVAIKKKIKEVIFDRNGYAYHGRVKALAEGAREGGLKF